MFMIDSLKGQVEEKQYINITYLDKGGMGQVFKAFDTVSNLEVAIKLIPILNQEEEELLLREINVSQEVSSKNLVKTYYTDKIEINNNEYFYIVQHFYQNGNLRKRIQRNIPYENCLKMFLDLLQGLKVLHSRIIHRDLKPENILIDENDNLVITDFGLAKLIGEKTKTKSYKGSGTIPYMSPECWLGQENKVQMDIYSLGIIFYELLTGEFPFNGTTEEEWRNAHLFDSFPNLDLKREGIPTKIKQIISKMTNKRANERYSNVEEIIIAITESIEQEKESNKEIERLASISHKKAEEIRIEKLKQEQIRVEKEAFKKNVNFHIEELKTYVESIVKSFNSRLEENKITIPKKNVIPFSKNEFTINLNRIVATFEFYDYDMNIHEEERTEYYKREQIRRHGFLINDIQPSMLKKKNIIYIGRVSLNTISIGYEVPFGFNLALVKSQEDIYGKWYMASFCDSGFSQRNRKNFSLDLSTFLKEFEKCFSMHTLTVDFQELEDKHIYSLIEEIIKI